MSWKQLFPLGSIACTDGAVEALARCGTTGAKLGAELVARHACGDWGELDAEDRDANDRAVAEGCRTMSAYTLSDGTRIWIITEADRSVTTLLLPDEY
jgi:hypothetical protein